MKMTILRGAADYEGFALGLEDLDSFQESGALSDFLAVFRIG